MKLLYLKELAKTFAQGCGKGKVLKDIFPGVISVMSVNLNSIGKTDFFWGEFR